MSGYQHNLPQNIDLKPRKHHGYAFLLFIMGTLFPPLAVAARFGVGRDFWINLLLTVCGYIPGHGHNFYIQNIRNNKTHARTPKWVQRYGLVDTSEIKRKERKSQWANRYKDRLPESTLNGQPYEDGQRSDTDISSLGQPRPQRTGTNDSEQLWRPDEEAYYNQDSSSGAGGRWRYPANFDNTMDYGISSSKKKKKKEKKDRWALTEDAYEEAGKKKRKKSKKSKPRSSVGGADDVSFDSSRDSRIYPEDPEGGLYRGSRRSNDGPERGPVVPQKTGDEVFQHQF